MLTGRTRYRIGWRKRLVIQVEYWGQPHVPYLSRTRPYRAYWRDATVHDMQAIDRGDVTPERPEAQVWWQPRRKPGTNPPPTYERPPPPPGPPPTDRKQ